MVEVVVVVVAVVSSFFYGAMKKSHRSLHMFAWEGAIPSQQ